MARSGAWTVVPYTEGDAAANLAETERLVAAVAAGEVGPTLRWYGYVGRAVIIGVGQGASTIADDLEARGIAVVRRLSGGAAVLADGEMLALDAVLPATSHLAGADVVASYQWFGEAWAAAIAGISGERAREGLRVVSVAEARRDRDALRRYPRDPGARAREATCFATLSPYEVAWQLPGMASRKLVGLSQVRRRGVALLQAGVHWRFDAAVMATLIAGQNTQAEDASALARHVADLEDMGLVRSGQHALIEAFEAEAARAIAAAPGAHDDPRLPQRAEQSRAEGDRSHDRGPGHGSEDGA